MCTSSMRACAVRYCPTAAPPSTMRSTPASMQRGQGAAPVRHEVVVDRVGLHHDDLALDEELGQGVAGPERGDVAGGQHERRAGVRPAGRRRRRPGRRRAMSRVTPGCIQTSAVVWGNVMRSKAPAGKTWTRSRPSGASRTGPANEGLPSLAMSRSASRQQACHAHERPDAGEELLPRLGRAAAASPLAAAGGGQPVVLGRHGVGDDLLQQVGARRGVGPRPRGGVVGDLGRRRVQRDGSSAVRRRRRRRSPVWSPVGATAPRLVMVMGSRPALAGTDRAPIGVRPEVATPWSRRPGAARPAARRSMCSRSSRSSTWR